MPRSEIRFHYRLNWHARGAEAFTRTGARPPSRIAGLEPRLKHIELMVEPARQRGEPTPSAIEVVDHLLAPLYMRVLFGAPGGRTFADHLTEPLVATTKPSPQGN